VVRQLLGLGASRGVDAAGTSCVEVAVQEGHQEVDRIQLGLECGKAMDFCHRILWKKPWFIHVILVYEN
jgi:hypothetical protein